MYPWYAYSLSSLFPPKLSISIFIYTRTCFQISPLICGERNSYFWWESCLVQPVWKTEQRFLKDKNKTGLEVSYSTSGSISWHLQFLIIYSQIWQDRWTFMFIAFTWNPLHMGIAQLTPRRWMGKSYKNVNNRILCSARKDETWPFCCISEWEALC